MWKHLRLSVKTGCSVRVKESMVGSVDGHSSAGLRPGKGDASISQLSGEGIGRTRTRQSIRLSTRGTIWVRQAKLPRPKGGQVCGPPGGWEALL